MSFLRFIEQLGNPTQLKRDREDALTNKINGFTVDTCFARDVLAWETGIKKDKNKHFIIVEEYPSKEDAVKKHKEWVSKVEKDKDFELVECRYPMKWFFGGV